MSPQSREQAGGQEAVTYSDVKRFPPDVLQPLYEACGWSTARHADDLARALEHSHSVVSAWHEGRLVGLGNALSDGHIVVYYPHLLVLPAYRQEGVGTEILERLLERYEGLHQQVVLADLEAVGFYEAAGFRRAAGTAAMWIYEARETHRLAP